MCKLLLGALTAALAIYAGGCAKQTTSSDTKAPETKTPETKGVHTLNLILGGPFVVVRESNCLNGSDCLKVWMPKVPAHSKPILFGFQGQFYELESMKTDYTLTGMTPAQDWTPLLPVAKTESWIIPGKTLHASPTPKKAPYLILVLPIPKQIVPWNADPMSPNITAPVAYAPGEYSRATMNILRYDYDDFQVLQLNAPAAAGAHAVDLHFAPLGVGNERVVMITVIPQKPLPGEDEHKHSHEAAKEAFATLGLTGDVDFPIVGPGYKRNWPLIQPPVLPDDLLNFINTDVTITKGRINDCKAMAIFVDATK